MIGVLIRGNLDTDTEKKDDMKTHREKRWLSISQGERERRESPSWSQKEPTLPAP